MARSTDVTSFTEHRRHLRAHLRQVRETGRPLFVTTNGRTDAVVLSSEAYDAMADQAELARSLAMVERSRLIGSRRSFRSLVATTGATGAGC